MLRLSPGDIYNGDAVEKTVEGLTREIAKKGYAFTQARPRGERNPADQTVAIRFVLDEGPRVYIERINIRGNTRTRDYVIRREFDIGEGDAYNRVLIDRAERRLNGLGYFKKVNVTNEPGSAPDRVDHERRCRGPAHRQLRRLGRLFDEPKASSAEVSVSESNFMGRGQAVRAVGAGRPARARRDLQLHRALFPRSAHRRPASMSSPGGTDAYNYSIYSSTSVGGTLRFGIPITDELSFSPHYSTLSDDDLDPEQQRAVPITTVWCRCWLHAWLRRGSTP